MIGNDLAFFIIGLACVVVVGLVGAGALAYHIFMALSLYLGAG